MIQLQCFSYNDPVTMTQLHLQLQRFSYNNNDLETMFQLQVELPPRGHEAHKLTRSS